MGPVCVLKLCVRCEYMYRGC